MSTDSTRYKNTSPINTNVQTAVSGNSTALVCCKPTGAGCCCLFAVGMYMLQIPTRSVHSPAAFLQELCGKHEYDPACSCPTRCAHRVIAWMASIILDILTVFIIDEIHLYKLD